MGASAQGCRIGTVDISNCYWNDIGTHAAYFSAVMDRLKGNGERVFIHPEAMVNRSVIMEGQVVVEADARIEQGTCIKNCLALPGAELKQNTQYENCIIGPDYMLRIR